MVSLNFAVANTGSKPDSIRWSVEDLGPGPDITVSGGPYVGVVYLGPAGPTSVNLPAVLVDALVTADVGQSVTVRLIARPDSDPGRADTCLVTVGVSVASTVPGQSATLVFAAGPAHPNPFHGAARIGFSLPARGRAAIRVHAADGRLVRTLFDQVMDGGPHAVDWDGRDDVGAEVPSGMYFYRLTGDAGQSSTGRVLRVR